MRKYAIIVALALLSPALAACGSSEDCEWEKEKNSKATKVGSVAFEARTSGGTSGGGRGGSSGSRGGSRSITGGSGGSKVKPPRPAVPPPAGYHWEYDCD